MDNFNVKEVLESTNPTKTITEINYSNSDSFIQKSGYSASEAYARLNVIRKTMKQLQFDIMMAGTNNMPKDTIELYETMKLIFRQIEAEEVKTIKLYD